MYKLANILKEAILGEKIIQVPQEILAKAKELFDYINAGDFKAKVKNKKAEPYLDSKLNNFFKLRDLKGNDKSISIGLYNDAKDDGAQWMDNQNNRVLINLAFFDSNRFSKFEDNIEHELVHAMDPRAIDYLLAISTENSTKECYRQYKKDKDLDKLYACAEKAFKKDADKVGSTSYYRSPAEFNAFTTPLVNKLANSLNKLGGNKQMYQELLISMLSDLKTQSVSDVLKNEDYAPLAWIFSKEEQKEENWDDVWEDYAEEVTKISQWVGKPTMYRDFLKRLGAQIS